MDEDDNVIGKASRKEVRVGALRHRIVKIIVIDKKDRYLIQKRSQKKDNFPSHWDLGCAETVASGETYDEAALRGLKEELGMEIPKSELCLQFSFKYDSPIHNANYNVYKVLYDNKLNLQKDEIDEIRFLKKEDIFGLIKEGTFHPAAALIFKKYCGNNF